MREDNPQNPYLLASVANALRIIRMLRARGTLTITAASNELGVSKAAAHRLLSTLVSEGFVLRDPIHRRYHPGSAMLESGLSSAASSEARQRIRRPLEALAAFTGETIKLIVLDGIHGRVVEAVHGTRTVRVGASIGDLQPANSTAGGKILLCYETEAELRARFKGRLPARTEDTVVDWDEFAFEMQRARTRGYAVNSGESTAGVNGLAVPLKRADGTALASLSLAAPADRLSRTNHRPVLAQMIHTSAAIDIDVLESRLHAMLWPSPGPVSSADQSTA